MNPFCTEIDVKTKVKVASKDGCRVSIRLGPHELMELDLEDARRLAKLLLYAVGKVEEK